MPDARYRDLMPGWAPEYLPPEVLFWRLCRSGLCLALVAGMAPGACPLRDACRDGAYLNLYLYLYLYMYQML